MHLFVFLIGREELGIKGIIALASRASQRHLDTQTPLKPSSGHSSGLFCQIFMSGTN